MMPRRSNLLDEAEIHLDRPLRSNILVLPHPNTISVSTDSKYLLWASTRSKPYQTQEEDLRNPMLPKFLSLNNAGPDKILEYARRWGCLGLCKHGLPLTYHVNCMSLWVEGKDAEPLDLWRNISGAAGALLEIETRLFRKKSVPPQLWKAALFLPSLEGNEPPRVGTPGERAVHEGLLQEVRKLLTEEKPARFRHLDRTTVAWLMQVWLNYANVRPLFRWESEKRRYILEFGDPSQELNLFSHLAQRLALALLRIDGWVRCSGCGNLYSPKRQPADSRQNWCKHCGRRAALRVAGRKRNKRVAQARRFYRSGLSLAEIARRMKPRGGIGQIKNWVKDSTPITGGTHGQKARKP